MASGKPDGASHGGPIDVLATVAQFHKAFHLPMRGTPGTDIDPALVSLRVDLLEEEVGEFVTAAERGDLADIADALADVVYVVYGTALTYGIDLDPVLREVHRSNMSKLATDGEPLVRDDGKVLKSDQYSPPDIASVLARQAPLSSGSGVESGRDYVGKGPLGLGRADPTEGSRG